MHTYIHSFLILQPSWAFSIVALAFRKAKGGKVGVSIGSRIGRELSSLDMSVCCVCERERVGMILFFFKLALFSCSLQSFFGGLVRVLPMAEGTGRIDEWRRSSEIREERRMDEKWKWKWKL